MVADDVDAARRPPARRFAGADPRPVVALALQATRRRPRPPELAHDGLALAPTRSGAIARVPTASAPDAARRRPGRGLLAETAASRRRPRGGGRWARDARPPAVGHGRSRSRGARAARAAERELAGDVIGLSA